MNCKQGDLAIIVAGPYTGVVVHCLKWVGEVSGFSTREQGSGSITDAWEIEVLGDPDGDKDKFIRCVASDRELRPLRGNPESIDERKPVEVEA